VAAYDYGASRLPSCEKEEGIGENEGEPCGRLKEVVGWGGKWDIAVSIDSKV